MWPVILRNSFGLVTAYFFIPGGPSQRGPLRCLTQYVARPCCRNWYVTILVEFVFAGLLQEQHTPSNPQKLL